MTFVFVYQFLFSQEPDRGRSFHDKMGTFGIRGIVGFPLDGPT